MKQYVVMISPINTQAETSKYFTLSFFARSNKTARKRMERMLKKIKLDKNHGPTSIKGELFALNKIDKPLIFLKYLGKKVSDADNQQGSQK